MGIENNPMPAWCGFQGPCRIFAGFRFIAYTYESSRAGYERDC
jgi:hypothetical protein